MLVIDTNVWISYSLFREGRLAANLKVLLAEYGYALSNKCYAELLEVLMRPKFDRFATANERETMLRRIAIHADWFAPQKTITDCRDPKDNKFLELAVASNAIAILTGDDDLLTLHPFRGIAISTVEAFAEKES